ncbi:MAG TPA: hypothetical protein ENK57_04300 [Polyangiaceae bacterium]|nr:hypothetical protein [Polyangiaceae bacterium]
MATAVAIAPAGGARAQTTQVEPGVAITYRGHDGCPDEHAFRDGVRARTSRARFVDEADADRHIEIDLVTEVGATRGRMTITELAGGRRSRREVTGEDCAIVVDALALVAALAIDPAASLTPRPPAPPPPERPEPPPTAPAVDTTPPARLTIPVHRADTPEPEPQVVAGTWRPVFAGQLQAASGLGSRLAPVLAAVGEVALDRDDWLSPSFRVSLSWMPPVEVDGGSGSGSFWRWGGQASGCPVGPRLVDIVVLRPCLGFELGALKARGLEVDESYASSTPWASVSFAGRAQIFPADWMLVEVQAELGFPLIRPRYLIEPDATVVRLSPVYGAFGSALGVRLP